MSTNQNLAQQLARVSEKRIAIFKRRIDELVKVHGSIRAVGRALNIDHAYLKRIADGDKVNPSKVIMKKLDLL